MTVNESLFGDWSRVRWTHFVCVLLGVGLATLIRFPIQPAIHSASPFLFYIPVVVLMALAFGQRFGLLATGLSVLPANYFWMVPDNAFEFNVHDFCQIISFSFAGISISWLSDTARKRKQLEEHLRATLATMGDPIITTDCHGRIVYLNAAAQMLTELEGQTVIGRMISDVLNLVAEDSKRPLNGDFQLAVNDGEIEQLPKRIILFSRSGRQYHLEQNASRILDASGRNLGMSLLFHRSASATLLTVAEKKKTC